MKYWYGVGSSEVRCKDHHFVQVVQSFSGRGEKFVNTDAAHARQIVSTLLAMTFLCNKCDEFEFFLGRNRFTYRRNESLEELEKYILQMIREIEKR